MAATRREAPPRRTSTRGWSTPRFTLAMLVLGILGMALGALGVVGGGSPIFIVPGAVGTLLALLDLTASRLLR